MEDTRYYIYLLTNKRHRIFFSGVTTNIKRRLKEHQRGEFNAISKKYDCTKLVYLEITFNMEDAWERKRDIESLNRPQKIQLITTTNPRWRNFGDAWNEKQFSSTSVLKESPLPAKSDMAPPNRLPDDEMLTFDFEDS